MARGNSSPNRSRSKSSSRSGITRSQSRRGRSPSPSRYGSHRYRRSQERRDSPWPRRKSTERQSQNRRNEEIWEEDGIDMKPLRLNAAEKVSTLPKIGEIYSEVKADVKNIEKRLKCLSEKLEMLSINEANEIADAVILLKFLKKSNPEIEMAGQMAHKGVLLMLQAEVLSKKGKELLEQSKNKIKSTMS
ncbi:unnamed protein product [Sphenostylis stenocarpa]|uniref:Uncharacterized protein n=1 Tax=Sphenostylis stenocarpa TaxID=92480 RepID=A0AA86SGK2_9FABA|nr:unnamed protein product [Sphenostylis stenocarpa]